MFPLPLRRCQVGMKALTVHLVAVLFAVVQGLFSRSIIEVPICCAMPLHLVLLANSGEWISGWNESSKLLSFPSVFDVACHSYIQHDAFCAHVVCWLSFFVCFALKRWLGLLICSSATLLMLSCSPFLEFCKWCVIRLGASECGWEWGWCVVRAWMRVRTLVAVLHILEPVQDFGREPGQDSITVVQAWGDEGIYEGLSQMFGEGGPKSSSSTDEDVSREKQVRDILYIL